MKQSKLEFFGESLARSILLVSDGNGIFQCAACGEAAELRMGNFLYPLVAERFAICYGQAVALCDEACYLMLRANWAPKGRN